jgi:hypothetical protein
VLDRRRLSNLLTVVQQTSSSLRTSATELKFTMKIKQRMLSVCAVLMTSLIGYEFAGVTSVTSSSSSTTLEMNYVIDSVECRARSSCHEQPTDYDPDEEGVVLTAADRNCMCDDKCSLYGDCCHDNRAVGTKNATSARGNF